MERVNFTNDPEFWKVSTNINQKLVLRFGGTHNQLEKTIAFLQGQIELCDENIIKGFMYVPKAKQLAYVDYYKTYKEVYGKLLQVCYDTKL